MSSRIVHIELVSTDIGASADFYRQLFNWQIGTFQPMDYTMTMFAEGETSLAFTPVDEEQGLKSGDVLVYVDVADIDATIARAKELGAPIYLDKMEIPTVGWMTIVGDPGGNRIAAMQRMAG